LKPPNHPKIKPFWDLATTKKWVPLLQTKEIFRFYRLAAIALATNRHQWPEFHQDWLRQQLERIVLASGNTSVINKKSKTRQVLKICRV
jgi:alpha-L-fucosidase